jgi:hypothetical protein
MALCIASHPFPFVIVDQALGSYTLKHPCLRPFLKASVRTPA